MAFNITIIGLGQIGSSIGLAVADQIEGLKRVGSDREPKIMRAAAKLGAVDKTIFNLPASVKEADLVILSLPTDQIRETLSIIAEDLKPNAVVMDTAPVKETIANWAKELLPEGRHYVGLTPVINPAYLQIHDSGVEAARADLFRRGLMVIVAPLHTPSEAVKLASDLTRILGASPLFTDPVEVDSLMAATHLLPQLLAAALLNITVDQPGWYEGRKLAGRAYTEVTGPLVQLGDAAGLASASLLAGSSMVRVIDNAIAALGAMRNDIQDQDIKTLTQRIERARSGRDHWWAERLTSNWAEQEMAPRGETPSSGEVFGRLIGLRPKQKPKP